MSGVGIIISRDDGTPLMSRIKDATVAAGLTLIMARAIGIQVKDHLVALNATRHKYGRNYYAKAARSVTTRAAAGFAMVSVTQIGIRQRLYGGTIHAKNVRYLTIPAQPAAYGMRAREFNDLKFAMAKNDRGTMQPALVRRASQAISLIRRRNSDGTVKVAVRPGEFRFGGEVMFWLVRSVTQRADPTVLPDREAMVSTGVEALKTRIERLKARDLGANP